MSHTDPRQAKAWGKYMESINWKVKSKKGNQIFIKRIPYLGFSVIKFQRPKNPLDFNWIDKIAKQNKAMFVNLEPHFEGFDESKLKSNGFKLSNMILSHTSTSLIDLTASEKKLWASFSENAKRNIKKVQNNTPSLREQKLKVKTVFMDKEKDDTEFRKFFELLKILSQHRKFYIPKYKEFYDKMMAFKKTSILLFAYQNPKQRVALSRDLADTPAANISERGGTARNDRDRTRNLPIASIWLAGYGDIIFYVQTGITEEGYQSLANYLLVWEGIKLAKKLGYKTWDFEGIFDPRFPKERERWKGFSEFKQRFHGQTILYPPSYIKIYSNFFKIIFFLSKHLP